MTMPPAESLDGGILAQILLELGKVQRDQAVILEKLSALPDQEKRLRDVQAAIPEQLDERLRAVERDQATTQAGRDMFARVISACAVAAAIAATFADYLHK